MCCGVIAWVTRLVSKKCTYRCNCGNVPTSVIVENEGNHKCFSACGN
jgi:hypothetical protein